VLSHIANITGCNTFCCLSTNSANSFFVGSGGGAGGYGGGSGGKGGDGLVIIACF